ncbi:hypothetical protein HU200_042380 [Digitaria exilis]|uniref:Transposase Tnp1/En/Spm-like domain-containing protein n=1 Tax=Digitaria exilis TaxID=1010633 RepID=A0A835B5T9_9POAL|nr:hypothetical protein HU200_042380 [Digitaria exilis]
MSLRNKGKVVASANLVTTDITQDVGGTPLGREYVGVDVLDLENIANENKGQEELPRPLFDIRRQGLEVQVVALTATLNLTT